MFLAFKKIKKLSLLVCLFVAVALFFVGTARVSAETAVTVENGCSPVNQTSFTASQTAPAKTYEIYTRLGKRGQRANVNLYAASGQATQCQLVGSAKASGDVWTPVGKWTFASDKDATLFSLTSATLDYIHGANRPAIMLVDAVNPACRPSKECDIKVNGQAGYVRPSGKLYNRDTLHLLRVVDPAKDAVKKVDYYIDDQIQYSKSSLQPFDMRYVSSNKQKLLRVISYSSGQRVYLPTPVPADYHDNFANLVFRFVRLNPKVLIVMAAVAGAITGLAILLIGLRLKRKRRQERVNQNLTGDEVHIASHRNLNRWRRRIANLRRAIVAGVVLLAVVLAVWIFSNFFIQAATVDGRSMENTYTDGNHVLVNKLSKTWSSISGREYVPRRGDVVIAYVGLDGAAVSDSDSGNQYIIKRVIGLPGEQVVIKGGHITIYNADHPNGFDPDKGSKWQKTMVASKNPSEYVDIKLWPSELFVSGDNRPVSVDSRYGGPIDTQQVIGTVISKLWP